MISAKIYKKHFSIKVSEMCFLFVSVISYVSKNKPIG